MRFCSVSAVIWLMPILRTSHLILESKCLGWMNLSAMKRKQHSVTKWLGHWLENYMDPPCTAFAHSDLSCLSNPQDLQRVKSSFRFGFLCFLPDMTQIDSRSSDSRLSAQLCSCLKLVSTDSSVIDFCCSVWWCTVIFIWLITVKSLSVSCNCCNSPSPSEDKSWTTVSQTAASFSELAPPISDLCSLPAWTMKCTSCRNRK